MTRGKQAIRSGAFSFRGNAWVFEVILGPLGARQIEHPNRILKTHRISNKRRAA